MFIYNNFNVENPCRLNACFFHDVISKCMHLIHLKYMFDASTNDNLKILFNCWPTDSKMTGF